MISDLKEELKVGQLYKSALGDEIIVLLTKIEDFEDYQYCTYLYKNEMYEVSYESFLMLFSILRVY